MSFGSAKYSRSDTLLRARGDRGAGFDGDENDMISRSAQLERRWTDQVLQPLDAPRPARNLVPCFTLDSLIATARGAVRAADLMTGDMVVTRDNGLQEICWTGSKDVSPLASAQNLDLSPIVIRAGALGAGQPAQDLVVSPNHRILLTEHSPVDLGDAREALVAAKHLIGLAGVTRLETASVRYHHFMCERHEIVMSDGAWSESFQPADSSLGAIDAAQRAELFALFPNLRDVAPLRAFASARRTLGPNEIQLGALR